jgi:integrase
MSTKKSLTTQYLNSALSPGRYYDKGYFGLHLHVRKTGSKAWVQRTTINKKYIDIGIGGYPKIKLSDARQIAFSNKLKAESGIDPRIKAPAPQEIPTFAEIAEGEINRIQKESKNEKHKNQWRSTLERYAYPTLGHMKVDEITVNDVFNTLLPIWSEITVTAKRVRGRIESVLDVAIVRGLRERHNPAVWRGNLEKLLPNPTKITDTVHQPAISQKDAQRWWALLKQHNGSSALALQALTLTASRSGEVRSMHWDQIKLFDKQETIEKGFLGVWKKPANIMKTKKTDHVPITLPLLEIIKSSGTNKGFIFPSPKPNQKLSDMALNQLMRGMDEAEANGFKDDESKRAAVPHGLRSTFRDWAASTEQAYEVAERHLAHRIGDESVEAYKRNQLLKNRAKIMDEYYDFLEGKA